MMINDVDKGYRKILKETIYPIIKIALKINNTIYVKSGVLAFINKILPKKKNLNIYLSIPEYSDNSLYMLNYCLKNIKEQKNVWISDRRSDKYRNNPKYSTIKIPTYYMWSIKGIYNYLRASRIFITHTIPGYCSSFGSNENQKIICLWHGMPIKGIGYMEKNIPYNQLIEYNHLGVNANFIVTSEYFKSIFKKSFHIDEKQIFVLGQPRHDIILSNTSENDLNQLIYQSVNHKKYEKYLLYTPTYTKKDRGGAFDVELNIDNIFGLSSPDLENLQLYLESHNLLLLVKPHPLDEEYYLKHNYIDFKNIILIYSEDLTLLNLDIYKILASIDLLITDYSSLYFEFLLLNKPIVIYEYFKSEYLKNRGFSDKENLDNLLIGAKAASGWELISAIQQQLNNDIYQYKRNEIKNKLNKFIDTRNCERIWSEFI